MSGAHIPLGSIELYISRKTVWRIARWEYNDVGDFVINVR